MKKVAFSIVVMNLVEPYEGDEGKQNDDDEPWPWWRRVCRLVAYLIGGFGFTIGSVAYLFSGWESGPLFAAVAYIVGSCGYLLADFQDLTHMSPSFAETAPTGVSVCGSVAYLIGSVGFIPAVAQRCRTLGSWGFIVGGGLAGIAQAWNVLQCCTSDGELSWNRLGVVTLGAISGFCWCGSTVVFLASDQSDEGAVYVAVVWMWIAGSAISILSGIGLAIRYHYE